MTYYDQEKISHILNSKKNDMSHKMYNMPDEVWGGLKFLIIELKRATPSDTEISLLKKEIKN